MLRQVIMIVAFAAQGSLIEVEGDGSSDADNWKEGMCATVFGAGEIKKFNNDSVVFNEFRSRI
jgi:hypothetical protein